MSWTKIHVSLVHSWDFTDQDLWKISSSPSSLEPGTSRAAGQRPTTRPPRALFKPRIGFSMKSQVSIEPQLIQFDVKVLAFQIYFYKIMGSNPQA